MISDRRFFISCALSNLIYSSVWLSYKSPVYIHIFWGKQVSWFFMRTHMYWQLQQETQQGLWFTDSWSPEGIAVILTCLWLLATYPSLRNTICFSAPNGTFYESALFSQEMQALISTVLLEQDALSCSFCLTILWS